MANARKTFAVSLDECLNWRLFSLPSPRRFPPVDYDTKPKHESKARKIGRAEETEMIGRGVEDRRTIDLDVKRHADHDGATPDARNRTATKFWTISSSTNYVAVSAISAVAVTLAVAQLISADISPATDGTAELEIFPCNVVPFLKRCRSPYIRRDNAIRSSMICRIIAVV